MIFRLINLLSILLCINAAYSFDTLVIEDLRYSWIDVQEDELRPAGKPSSLKLIAFLVDESQGDLLQVCNDEPFDLWVNMQMLLNQADGCTTLNLREIRESVYSDSLLFHTSTNEDFSTLSTKLLRINELSDDSVFIESRSNKDFLNFYFLVVALGILFIGVFRKIYPLRFERSTFNPFKARGSSIDEYYSDFFRSDNTLFITLFSFIVSLCFHFLEVKNFESNYESTSFFGFLKGWSFKWLLVTAFIYIKYIFGIVISSVFSLRAIANIQNQDFCNYFFWVFMLVLGLNLTELAFANSGIILGADYLIFFIVVSVVIFQIGIFMKTYKSISFNKILIISYLCGTEFIPGFIIIYVLLR